MPLPPVFISPTLHNTPEGLEHTKHTSTPLRYRLVQKLVEIGEFFKGFSGVTGCRKKMLRCSLDRLVRESNFNFSKNYGLFCWKKKNSRRRWRVRRLSVCDFFFFALIKSASLRLPAWRPSWIRERLSLLFLDFLMISPSEPNLNLAFTSLFIHIQTIWPYYPRE